MTVTWCYGASGTGKTYEYIKLCEAFSPEDIYFCNDFENGGFDMYIENGAPRILFLDEYKTVSVSGAEYKNKLQLLELASIDLLSKKETSAGCTG